MNRITGKLKSNNGASITFALLLFLVCAVFAAVILVAGTSAAGRMSGLAENDQRYYAVTSAAEMIRDMLDDETISILKVGGTDKAYHLPMNQITDSVVKSPAGTPISTDTDTDTGTEGEAAGGSESGASDAAADDDSEIPSGDDTVETNSLTIDTARLIRAGTTYTTQNPRKLYLTSTLGTDSTDSSTDPLAVTIDESIDADGNLNMVIYNTNGDPFKMMLTFKADSKEIYPPVTKLSGYTITEPREITWHFSKMVSSYDASLQ